MVPRDAACGGALEPGVMRPNQVGHFCRIVLIRGWLGFASLSQTGEIVRCYLSLVLCIASRKFSSLSSCQNGWFKVGTCNACSGICANLKVHTRSAWSFSVFFLSCNGSTGFSAVRQNLFIHAGRLLVWLCATPAQSFWLWCF